MKQGAFLRSLCLMILLLGVSSCSDTSVVKRPEIQPGPRTATGVVVPADLSLTRRGTHLLVSGGKESFYLESKSVSLSTFEGQTVSVDGTLEVNTRPSDLPILVVQKIERALGSGQMKIWKIPALNISLNAPAHWQGRLDTGMAHFTLPGESLPLITIRSISGSSLPPGKQLFIKNRRAVTTEPQGSAVQEIYILEKGNIIIVHFDPSTQSSVQSASEARVLAAEFQSLVSELEFISDGAKTSSRAPGLQGEPCGGPAGILCPTGSYCEIDDAGSNTGRCKGTVVQ